MLLELIGGQATAPGATETTLTAFSGQTFQVRDFRDGAKAKLLAMWNFVAGAGISKIKSPRFHDNVQGIRQRSIAASVVPAFMDGEGQDLVSNDILTYSLSGSATAGDIESAYALVSYSGLQGINARYIGCEEAKSRAVNFLTVEVSLTAGTTGNWSGTAALTANFDLLKAGKDYAVIGYRTNVLQGAVCFYGIDTGNLRVGGPGCLFTTYDTSNWFAELSTRFKTEAIPVINANNKTSVYVETANNENAASPVVNLYLIELS
jgi:hypothetical protein